MVSDAPLYKNSSLSWAQICLPISLPRGASSATQDDLLPFLLTLLRNSEASSHVPQPHLFFSFLSKHAYFLSLLFLKTFYFCGCSLLCSNLKSEPFNMNISLIAE